MEKFVNYLVYFAYSYCMCILFKTISSVLCKHVDTCLFVCLSPGVGSLSVTVPPDGKLLGSNQLKY